MDFIKIVKKPYDKLPGFSDELGHFVFKLVPYIALFGGTLLTLASVSNFLGFAFISSFTLSGGGIQLVQELLVRSVLGVAQGIIMVFAYAPLKKGQISGLRLLIWSQFIWIISGVLGLSVWFVLGVILIYPLYKIEKYYK